MDVRAQIMNVKPIPDLIVMRCLCLAAVALGSDGVMAQTPTDEPQSQQRPQSFVPVEGILSDDAGVGLEGYRVVFREVGKIDSYVSMPTDAEGRYVVSLPENGGFEPVAVFTPRGGRISLDGQPLVRAVPEARHDISIDPATEADALASVVQIFPGSDRLLLSFIEDAVNVENYHFEFQLDVADFENADRLVARAIAAFQFDRLSGVEFGASLGLGSLDTATSDEAGLTDLEAWFKFPVYSREDGTLDVTVGTVATLPVGDSDAGLGADSLRSKLFAAVRRSLGFGVLSAHAGIRLNEDGEIAGEKLDGRLAPAAGAALIAPVSGDVVLFVEVAVEGKRFAGDELDARLLGGINWRLLELLTLRGGIGLGLADGAPDTQLLVGFSMDF